MCKLVITSNNAGGGHRAAAAALSEIISRQRRPWSVDILDLDVALESIDPCYVIAGFHSSEIYNFCLRKGLTIRSRLPVAIMHAGFFLQYPLQVRSLRRHWRHLRPTMVVSVNAHYNRALYVSLQAELPGTPFVTILTDFADCPPRFWLEPQDQDVICGTDLAVEQANKLIPNKEHIWRSSGMILHPRFYEPIEKDRRHERKLLGLDPDLPTGMVFFGGIGSEKMLQIARCMATFKPRVQLIFMCGKNSKLASKLRLLQMPYPASVQEFTHNIEYFMWLSDFFVGKPGPGAISEALAMGLPVILQDNLQTMDHEVYNIKWVEEMSVGLGIRRIAELPNAIAAILEPTRFGQMQERISRLQNRAVFEIPDMLASILARNGL